MYLLIFFFFFYFFVFFCFFFFFSSRRRHTRWPRDWSSDVCSSDLQPALCTRDQVHDPGWIRRDHASARRLLRTIVEVETDVSVRGEVEAERGERREAHLGCAFLRVRRIERRQPAHVAHVRRGWLLVAVRTEEAGEPAFAHLDEGPLDLVASCLQHGFQLVQRDLLLLFVPCDRIGLFAQLGFELFVGAQQF